MANANTKTEQKTTEQKPNTGATRGRRILKFGLLASDCTVSIDGPVKAGQYGKMDVPLTIDGQRFILPMSPQHPQFQVLQAAFGADGEWTGCTVRIADGKMLKQVNVSPVADADGKPVA